MDAAAEHRRVEDESLGRGPEELREAWAGLRSPSRGFPVIRPTMPELFRYREAWRGRLEEAARSGAVEQVRRGVHLAREVEPHPELDRELVAIAAVGRRLRTWYLLSHRTAGRALGLWVPRWDGKIHVTQESVPSGKRVADGGLVRHCAKIPVMDCRTVDGMAVTSVERTAVDCARSLPMVQALPVVDSALVIGADRAVMDRMLQEAAGGRGVRAARDTVSLATARSGSPAESVVRARIVMDGLPEPETLLRVLTVAGEVEVDLGWEELKLGIEVHGKGKYAGGADPYAEAVRRENLNRAGWRIIDVRTGQRPAVYLSRIRTALRELARQPRSVPRQTRAQ